jgi:deoxyadenosine/deoxycytidine kinase
LKTKQKEKMEQLPALIFLGPIGAGKSTAVKGLEIALKKKGYAVSSNMEPSEHWKETGALADLYDFFAKSEALVEAKAQYKKTGDPKPLFAAYDAFIPYASMGFKFQVYAFITRFLVHAKRGRSFWKTQDAVLWDGHPETDKRIFADTLHQQGKISSGEMVLYEEIFDSWKDVVPLAEPLIYIYLKADTKTALGRIHERGRKEEKDIQGSYIDSLTTRQDKLAQNPLFAEKMIVVDANANKEQVVDQIITQLEEKKIFIRLNERREKRQRKLDEKPLHAWGNAFLVTCGVVAVMSFLLGKFLSF